MGPGVGARRRPRRDFCQNAVIDRGIALRENLGIEQPRAASTLLHGLKPGQTYHFTVSCVSAYDGTDELRESPPSLMSKPLTMPASDDAEWSVGEIIERAFGHGGSGGAVVNNQKMCRRASLVHYSLTP